MRLPVAVDPHEHVTGAEPVDRPWKVAVQAGPGDVQLVRGLHGGEAGQHPITRDPPERCLDLPPHALGRGWLEDDHRRGVDQRSHLGLPGVVRHVDPWHPRGREPFVRAADGDHRSELRDRAEELLLGRVPALAEQHPEQPERVEVEGVPERRGDPLEERLLAQESGGCPLVVEGVACVVEERPEEHDARPSVLLQRRRPVRLANQVAQVQQREPGDRQGDQAQAVHFHVGQAAEEGGLE